MVVASQGDGGEAGQTQVTAPSFYYPLFDYLLQANENSGYIGAAIIGAFLAIVASWYLVVWLWKKWNTRPSHGQQPSLRIDV
jgi:hypothetical protein